MTFLFRIYNGTLQNICLVEAPTAFTQSPSRYRSRWIGSSMSFRDEKGMLEEIFTEMKR